MKNKEKYNQRVFTWLISYLSRSFRSKNKIYFRVADMKPHKFPEVKIQVVNTRNTFDANVHDLIHSGDISNFSTLDVVLITYIATLDEVESKDTDISEICVKGIKQRNNEILYCVKDMISGNISYQTASELRKSRGFLSLSKQEISDISYSAGYTDAWKKAETLRMLNNNIKIEIKDVIISNGCVEMRVLRKKDEKLIDMDITEVLFKKDLLSKEDNFVLGKLEALKAMNSFEHKQQDQ